MKQLLLIREIVNLQADFVAQCLRIDPTRVGMPSRGVIQKGRDVLSPFFLHRIGDFLATRLSSVPALELAPRQTI